MAVARHNDDASCSSPHVSTAIQFLQRCGALHAVFKRKAGPFRWTGFFSFVTGASSHRILKWLEAPATERLFVDVGFQEPCQTVEIAVGVDVANDSHQCFWVNQVLKWLVVQVQLPCHADHDAVEFLLR